MQTCVEEELVFAGEEIATCELNAAAWPTMRAARGRSGREGAITLTPTLWRILAACRLNELTKIGEIAARGPSALPILCQGQSPEGLARRARMHGTMPWPPRNPQAHKGNWPK